MSGDEAVRLTEEEREWVAWTIVDAAAERDTDDAARLIEARLETLISARLAARDAEIAARAEARTLAEVADRLADWKFPPRLVTELRERADALGGEGES